MAKRKWNKKRNGKNHYSFPSQEPWCKKDKRLIGYARVFNQCLTRGYDGSACEHFCLKNIKTGEILEFRRFYEKTYLRNGQNGGNGHRKQIPYCSHHDYNIRKKKAIKKCLTCGQSRTVCYSFYIKDQKTGMLINPREFYEEEFRARKV